MSKDKKKVESKEEKSLEVKQAPGGLGEYKPAKDEWDLGQSDSSDIIIPKLVVLQSTSKLVSSEKAQFGDIANTVTGEILGTAREKDKKPVRFIPFKEEKTWTIFEVIGSKPEFRGTEPRTALNNDLPREYEKGGKKFKRYQTLSYFILLVEDLEKSDMPLPYVVSFRSTSFKAGRVLSTHFLMCKAALQRGKVVPPPATVFELSGTKTSNDKGTFYIMDVKDVGVAKPEWVGISAQWLKTMKTKSYQIDESEVAEVEVEVDVAVRDIKQGEVQEGAQF